MKQVRPYTKYGAIVPIIFSFVRMDNIESLKLDEIDIFLEEKISDEPPVNDERIARVLTESNRLFNHIVSQIIYLYYQSFHYGATNS